MISKYATIYAILLAIGILIWVRLILGQRKMGPTILPCDRGDIIRTLLRQCARWVTAAVQDNNPLVAILHMQYGMGYFHALGDIATQNEIEQGANISWTSFRTSILKIQDQVNRRVVQACPELVRGLPRELALLGGES